MSQVSPATAHPRRMWIFMSVLLTIIILLGDVWILNSLDGVYDEYTKDGFTCL